MQCLAEFCGDDGKPPRRCRPPTGRPALCRERCPKGEQQRARGPGPPLPFDGTPPSRDRDRVTHGKNDASTEELATTVLELWRRYWTRSTIWLKMPGDSTEDVVMSTIESEKFRPDSTRLALVRRSVDDIEPDRLDLQDWLQAYARHHCHRIALDLEIVERYSTRENVIIDCGCVPLILTASLKALGYNVHGIDIDPSRFSSTISKLNLRVSKCNIETEALPLETGSCDMVIFNELFEHLRINPIFTIGEVRRVLRSNGMLLLSTPNLRSLKGLANFLLRNKAYSNSGDIYHEYQKLERLGHMGHVREYTTAEVSEFLSRLGFHVQTLVFRGRYKKKGQQLAARVLPRLRPFVTYIARAQ
jgi:2-polyprenyl-3-methyl-5-hydroxy-6-metoxy-1,4-benzoquinol methylase